MLTDAEHEEVLRAIGFLSHAPGYLHPSIRPAISSPTVRAQMTDWLHERCAFLQSSHGAGGWRVTVTMHDVLNVRALDEMNYPEALARAVLEVSRADD